MKPQDQKKLNWTRLAITAVIVIVTAGAIGGATWYVMEGQAEKEKGESDKQIEELQKQLDLESNKEEETTTTTKSDTAETTKDSTSPTVSVVGKLQRYADAWKFQFSKNMDKTTLKLGNINLYSVGGSVGTVGRKDLSNDTISEFHLNYDEKDNVLTIPVDNKDYLSCASCTWEFEFTSKVKDSSGNALVPKSFPMN